LTVFVDTGGWIALLHSGDRWNESATAYWEHRLRDRERFVTTSYVVQETATRLRYDTGLRSALVFRRLVDESLSKRRLGLVWVDPALERKGWEILERYGDVPLSLTDAISAAVARRAKITEIFGFDRDFHALGFDVQPAV